MRLNELTVHELAEKLGKGEASSVDATRAVFERIKAVDEKVHAYLWLSTFAGIAVKKDDGAWFIWAATAMLLIGLAITFYVPRRRLWIKRAPLLRRVDSAACHRICPTEWCRTIFPACGSRGRGGRFSAARKRAAVGSFQSESRMACRSTPL